jgi:hypothetical protein
LFCNYYVLIPLVAAAFFNSGIVAINMECLSIKITKETS